MSKTFSQPLCHFNIKCIWFFFILGALLATSCSPKTHTAKTTESEGNQTVQSGMDRQKLTHLSDSLANLLISAGEVPGLSVAVAQNGKILLSKGYGKADVAAGTAVTPQTVFGITSISKQFAAATVLTLVEKGKISLDDPISKYLPEFPVQGREVTVRHLLNHTSGTPSMRNTSSQPDKDWFSKDLSFQEMVDRFGKEPFEFVPGQKHAYNNFAYLLLGEIIGRVTGMPWSQYLEKEIFQPLGIQHTKAGDAKRAAPNSAKAYLVNDKKVVEAPFVSMHVLGASGDLFSTAEDLVKWSSFLHSGKVLEQATFQPMVAPTVLASGEKLDYGFGLYLGKLGEHQKFYHGGSRPWGGYLAHYPATGLSIAVLTNSAGTGREKAEAMEGALARAALGIKDENIPLTPAEMARYEGNYTLVLGARTLDVRVFVEDGQLIVQPAGQKPGRLLNNGNHAFTHSHDSKIKVDFTMENGRAEGMVLHQNGRDIPGKRKL